jgi:hypothetical protein
MTQPPCAHPLRALTLWPEWAWAITQLGKDVENRDWRPSRAVLSPGDWLAIHAGAVMGGGNPSRKAADAALRGVLETHARVTGLKPLPEPLSEPTLSAIVALVRYSGADGANPGGWAVPGAYHWRWDRMITLATPIPCRGERDLWPVPEAIVAQILPHLPPKEPT